ncbi:MAG: c-type cytochrome [Chloroflexota bacterium]|nr:c-type cytochrome [Chloroflexota bacterium]
MSDERTGRELTPRPDDAQITPVPDRAGGVERFSSGDQTHTVGLTEERAAQVVRQSGNARSVSILAVLIVALFVPIYWFYDIGVPALGAEGRLEAEAEVQYVTDVSRGYALYLANCARCHGENGEGGIGPALNDQEKLYNALTPEGLPGTGHFNPVYLERVLEVGGRYVCGDPDSLMPAWLAPAGPLNYREVEEIIDFLTASSELEFEYDPGAHGAEGEDVEGGPEGDDVGPRTVIGWRDTEFQPEPGAPTPPACWKGEVTFGGGGGGEPSAAPVESPGTAEAPREIAVEETASLEILAAEEGTPLTALAVVPGEFLTFDVTNTAGNIEHNFIIGPAEALESNSTADLPGTPNFTEGTETFEWQVPEDPAELEGFQFACTVPGHYEPMHGDLIVQEGE